MYNSAKTNLNWTWTCFLLYFQQPCTAGAEVEGTEDEKNVARFDLPHLASMDGGVTQHDLS